MSDWAPRKLRVLIGVPISGSRPAGGVDSQSEGVPSLGGENILSDGGVTFTELKRVPRAFHDSMPRGHLQPFDVLINKDGAQTGKVGIYKGEFDEACVNEHLFILRNREGAVDQRFLYYSLLLPETQSAIARRITGSAQPGLNSGFVDAVEIRLPSESGLQRRIAEILSTVDEAIEQTEKLIAKHQQIKTGLMHDLFTRGLTPAGHLRPPYSECPDLYKDSPLGPIPKEWEVRRLSELVRSDITYGIVQAGPHVDDGIPYIRTGDMTGGELVKEGLLRTTPTIADAYRRSRVEAGDLVIAIRATVGRVLPVALDLDGANLTQGTARIAPSAGIHGSYLLWCLRSGWAQREIELRTKGTTFSEVALRDLRRVGLAVPLDFSEQQRIAAPLDSCICAEKMEIQRLWKLCFQKRGLMHDLLTGEVEVPIPEADDGA